MQSVFVFNTHFVKKDYAPDRGELITLVAGNRRRLFLTGDDNKVFMTKNKRSCEPGYV